MNPPRERIAEVALGLPVRHNFHYRIPESASDLVSRGSVVVVPFGRRFTNGFVTAVGGEPPASVDELRLLSEVLEPGAAIPPELFTFAESVADYYLAPLGEVLRAALPTSSVRSRLRARISDSGRAVLLAGAAGLQAPQAAILRALVEHGPLVPDVVGVRAGVGSPRERLRKLELDGLVTLEPVVRRTARAAHQDLLELVGEATSPPHRSLLARSRGARDLIALLQREVGPVPWVRARVEAGVSRAIVRRLQLAGLVRTIQVEVARDLQAGAPASRRLSDLTLSPAQVQVVAAVAGAIETGGFHPMLLHGVTGSGKTLVYLESIAATIARGRAALLLVPEIGLTTVLARELRGRFGDSVAVLHSALKPGERYDAWRRVRSGQARVVFGARSAIFAPAPDLGLVIVDEEHDSSYKQGDRPHYHARDIAVLRAKLLGIPVLLGSATPSLESYENAQSGRYALLELPERTAGQALPAVEIVDMRDEFERAGSSVIVSERLEGALRERLRAGEQSVVLLNRRGYASFLLCRECGNRCECPHCSVSLTYHQGASRMRCHHCGYSVGPPRACPACKGSFLHLVGYGTEQVEALLKERFPEARIARLDSDTARARDEIAHILGKVERHEVDILVGTQMVAKGHDFPLVTLVGVVSVDAMLGLPDFRATERAFGLLTQVAGRAGRGDRPGLVVLQTFYPENEAVRLACLQDYPSFFAREIRLRKLMRYPPASHLINLILRGREREKLEKAAHALGQLLRGTATEGVGVRGPALAPIQRLKREFRSQLLLKSTSRRALRRALASVGDKLRALIERGRLDVDVDPQDLL